MRATPTQQSCLGRYAFLIHPTSLDELHLSAPPCFDHFSAEQRAGWCDWIGSWSARHYEPGIAYHLPAMHSRAGGYVEGWLISVPLTPQQMMRLRPRERAVLMAACVALAKELGADILGLGAFTSIITRNGADLADCGIAITTGNSLTAMAAAESIKLAARRRAPALDEAALGVIGAAGSVGSLACKHLADVCGDLTLFGNPGNPQSLSKLKRLAGEIYQAAARRVLAGEADAGVGAKLLPVRAWLATLPPALLQRRDAEARSTLYDMITWRCRRAAAPAPISLSVDPQAQLPRMAYLISATSQGKACVAADWLGTGAVVCDVARPADVHAGLHGARADLTVYEGGLLRLPEPVRFGRRNVIGCAAGINLACLSETMTLALSGIRRNYSVGAEPPLADAREVLRLALHHGFEIISPLDEAEEADQAHGAAGARAAPAPERRAEKRLAA